MSLPNPPPMPPTAVRMDTTTTSIGTSERVAYQLNDMSITSIQAALNQALTDGAPGTAVVNLAPSPAPPHIVFAWGNS